MAAKFLVLAAVPFQTARLQASLNRNVVRKIKGVEKNEMMARDTTDSGSSVRVHALTTEEKMHLRCIGNQVGVQTFQGKAKQQGKLVNQHVSRLKYEKMNLLSKIEALRMQNGVLELENECLKFEVLGLQHLLLHEGNNVEPTSKHALFVNIPLCKELVLPKIFIFLLMSMWESVKQNVLILNEWTPYVNMSLKSSLRYLLQLGCLPWKLMIPLTGYRCNPLIMNG